MAPTLPPRRTGSGLPFWAGLTAFGTGLAMITAAGCGASGDLQPANNYEHRVVSDHSSEDNTAAAIAENSARNSHSEVLPIFPIGDDYKMLELPNINTEPGSTTETNGKHVPVAFYIPASPETVTGRPEKLCRLAAGVLYRDTSGALPVYRLADFARAKLGTQLVLKAFNTFNKEKGAALPAELKLEDGFPAIFSAAYIYRDLDMIEKPKPAQPPAAVPESADGLTPVTDAESKPAERKVRIIRTDDMDAFLKENKADVLALLVVEIDETHAQEHLVSLWLWGRDPVTKGLFAPSACVQANKIDEQWPEASEPEMIGLWHSLMELERQLAASKTVSVNLPAKTK